MENLQKEKCKEVTETKTSTTAKTKPIISFTLIYRPEINKNRPMKGNKKVECTTPDRIISEWTEEVEFNEKYDGQRKYSLVMLSEFKYIGMTALAKINAVNYWIEQTSQDRWPIHWLHYRAGLQSRELTQDKTDKLFRMHVIDLAQAAWARVLGPNKHGALQLPVNYWKLHALTVREAYLP